jgi:hypothetical protein
MTSFSSPGSALKVDNKAWRLVFDYTSDHVPQLGLRHTTDGILLPILMTRPATRESLYLVRRSGMADLNQSSCGISRKVGLLPSVLDGKARLT